MAFTDILINIDSYPTPSSFDVIEQAVNLGASLGPGLTGLAVEVQLPVHSNQILAHALGLGTISREEEDRSGRACVAGLEHFSELARQRRVFRGALHRKALFSTVGDYVAKAARVYDLVILPLTAQHDGQLETARGVIFASGRPVLIFRAGEVHDLAERPKLIVIAWDGSAAAARALGDARPLLPRAKHVRLLTILNEKADAVENLGAEALRHLKAHGIAATIDEVDAEGRPVGVVLDHYLKQCKPDLLVMGAYGCGNLSSAVRRSTF
jgi:nucleotide-binding universal stress UspA family protein